MKNWKTSLFGSIAAVCTALSQTPGLEKYKLYFIVGATIGGSLFAFFSKDHNITGT